MRLIFAVMAFLTIASSSTRASAESSTCQNEKAATGLILCGDFRLSVYGRVVNFLHYQENLHPGFVRENNEYGWFEQSHIADQVIRFAQAEQDGWVSNERDQCGDNYACLVSAYEDRIDNLLLRVRLEEVTSHPGNMTHFNSIEAEKEVLLMIAQLIENIDRHGIFPSFKSGANFFATYGPRKNAPVSTPIFYENADYELQGPLGWSVNVDYENLSKCMANTKLNEIVFSGIPMTLDTVASIPDCIEFKWHDISVSPNGQFYFPEIQSPYIRPVNHPLETARTFICQDFTETNFVCADPNRKRLIETVENMANWAVESGYATEQTVSQILYSWKLENLAGFIEDDPSSINIFEEASLSVINTLSHMQRFPNELDFQRCRFDQRGVLVCPTISMFGSGALQISGTTEICEIEEYRYRITQMDSAYSIEISGPGFPETISIPLKISSAGTGPCRHQYLEAIPGGEIVVLFSGGCSEDEIGETPMYEVVVRDFEDSRLTTDLTSIIPSGACHVQSDIEIRGPFEW